MPVKGYEGYYEVDQFGRVYGCDRVVHVEDNGREYDKPIKGKQLKQTTHSAGYKVVGLTKDGTTKGTYVHRIVAEAFIPNPDNLPMVNHKDEDKSNNFVDNLEWCTAAYNSTYGSAIERSSEKKRGVPLSEKHKEDIAKSLKGYYKSHTSASIGHISEKRKSVVGRRDGEAIRFPSVKDAAIAVKGARSNITRSCNSKTKTAYGYKWSWDCCSYGGRRKDEQA